MRFGHWRGVMLAVALFSSMATARTASADGFHYTIPREVLARDLNTGGPYFAPPIPWGHYAKSGHCDHFFNKGCILCKLCLGKGCGHCGGKGCFGGNGGGLFHHGGNAGGLFHHGGDPGCGDPGCGHGRGHGRRLKDCGLCKGKGCGLCRSSRPGEPIHSLASEQSAPSAPAGAVATSPQVTPVASPQCSEPGCKLGKGHHHGDPSMGDPCDGCGGRGCGKCHGLGRLFGGGEMCGSCGGKGCGLCGGLGRILGKLCSFCGGKGCGHCGKGGHLKGKLAGLFHHNGIKYFVGPGGPVPLTPGYVPYVVPTRSPRDFLAFPPYTPSEF